MALWHRCFQFALCGHFPEFALDLQLALRSHWFRKRGPSATVHLCSPCCLVPQICCATHSPIRRYSQLQESAAQHARQALDRVRIARQAQLAAGIARNSICLTKAMRSSGKTPFPLLPVEHPVSTDLLCNKCRWLHIKSGMLMGFVDQSLISRGHIGSQGPLPIRLPSKV